MLVNCKKNEIGIGYWLYVIYVCCSHDEIVVYDAGGKNLIFY